REERWKDFKLARNRWNLRFAMAGPVPASIKEAEEIAAFDAADLAGSADEYEKIVTERKRIEGEISKRMQPVHLGMKEDRTDYWLVVGPKSDRATTLGIKLKKGDNIEALKKELEGGRPVRAEEIKMDFAAKPPTATIRTVTVEIENQEKWENFAKDL